MQWPSGALSQWGPDIYPGASGQDGEALPGWASWSEPFAHVPCRAPHQPVGQRRVSWEKGQRPACQRNKQMCFKHETPLVIF